MDHRNRRSDGSVDHTFRWTVGALGTWRILGNETKIAPRSAEIAAKYRRAAGAAQAAESVGPATRQLVNQGYRYARNVALYGRNAAHTLQLKVETGQHPYPPTPLQPSL